MVNLKVNTKAMLPDEYSHYVLRYSAIQSGLSGYNLDVPPHEQNGEIHVILQSMYEAMFDNLMDDLEDYSADRRVCVLDYFIEQIEREEMRRSLK